MRRQAFVMCCVLWAGSGVCLDARAGSVEVQGNRILMGDLLPGVAEPWASLDMGAAPQPLQQIRITHEDIAQRLVQACLPAPPEVVVPRVLRVVRPGQVISEPQLATLVRQELIHLLPPGSHIQTLRLSGGVALPPGRVHLAIALPQNIQSGAQTLRVMVEADPTPIQRGAQTPTPQARQASVAVTAFVELEMLAKRNRVPVMGRGSEVVVQVRSGGVLIQSSGLAQEAGSIGDIVSVLPNHGSRVLHARIVNATTVEVRL